MKLHVLLDFDVEISTEMEDGVFLISKYNHSLFPKGARVIYLDTSFSYTNLEYFNSTKNILDSLGDIYLPCLNTIYIRFFLPLNNVFLNIEKILTENEIDEIVLYGGSNHIYYAADGAEGEGLRSSYMTNWMVNPILNEKLKNKYDIVWKYKGCSWRYAYKNSCKFLKEMGHLLLSKCRKSLTIGKDKNNSYLRLPVSDIGIVDLRLQVQNLKDISRIRHKDITLFTRAKELCDDEIKYIPDLRFSRIVSVVMKNCWAGNKALHNSRYFAKHALRRECLYLLIKYKLMEERLKDFFVHIDTKDSLFITDMTFGFDINSVNEAAKSLGVEHYNYQHVSMAIMLYPNLEVASKYFVYAKKVYELYRQYSNSYFFYFPVIQDRHDTGIKNDVLVLTIFMQPDDIVYDYLDLMTSFFDIVSKSENKLHIIVKPHYRQNEMDKVESICDKYNFVELAGLQDGVGNILERTDISLTVFSSVIFESMCHNVMTLIYNPADKYHSLVYDTDICYPEINPVVNKVEDIALYVNNFQHYYDGFLSSLKQFEENQSYE